MRTATGIVVLVVLLAGAFPSAAAAASVPNTERVNVSSTGAQANAGTPDQSSIDEPSISLHGRYVAFSSAATNLVASDTNGVRDVFLRDRQTGTTRRVSVSSLGVQANGASTDPSISATGRYIAFTSDATNLVKRDTNGYRDVFVYDRTTRKTVRVSLRADGGQANRGGFEPVMSADGQHVVFVSSSWNLVTGDTNNAQDIFVRDLGAQTTERVNVSSSGAETTKGRPSDHPSISGDGRYVAFDSQADNLVPSPYDGATTHIFVRDRMAGTTERLGPYLSGVGMDFVYISGGTRPSISADGRYVAYQQAAEDADGVPGQHVYLHDRVDDTTVRVSQAPDGERGNGSSDGASVDANGRYVAFSSAATNLVSGDSATGDVFRWDRLTGLNQRISVSTAGVAGNDGSASPSISGDGVHVAFGSLASNLVAGDTNDQADVFVRNLG